jgi:hypothetical protein
MQAMSGITMSQITDAFTLAFKESIASALGISSASIEKVTYAQTRRQLLAGILVQYCLFLFHHFVFLILTGPHRQFFL